jgi:hypothetical protein
MKIHITNFGPFKERQTFSFANITLHYGLSGTGKSILNHAFKLFTGNPTLLSQFHNFEMSDIMDYKALVFDITKPFVLEFELPLNGHVINRIFSYEVHDAAEGTAAMTSYEMHWNDEFVFGFDNQNVCFQNNRMNTFLTDVMHLLSEEDTSEPSDSMFANELLDGIYSFDEITPELIENTFPEETNFYIRIPRVKPKNHGLDNGYIDYMETFECIFQNVTKHPDFYRQIVDALSSLYQSPNTFCMSHYAQFDSYMSKEFYSGTVVRKTLGYNYRKALREMNLAQFHTTCLNLGLPILMEDKLIDKYGNKHGYTYFAQHKNGMRIHYSMLGDGDKLLYDMVYHLCLIKEDHLPSRQKRDMYLFFIDSIDFFSTGRGNAKILDVLSKAFPQITFVCSTKSRELVNEVLSLYEENNYRSDALNILSFTKDEEGYSASIMNHEILESYLVSPSV